MHVHQKFRQFGLSAAIVIACITLFAVRAPGQFNDLFGKDSVLLGGLATGDPKVQVKLTAANTRPGDEVTLAIIVTLPRDSYTYSTNRDFGGGTKIEIKEVGLTPIVDEFQSDRAPKSEEDEFNGHVEKFYGHVTWTRKYRIQPNIDVRQIAITGLLDFQVCTETTCRLLKEPIQVALSAVRRGGTDELSKKKPLPVIRFHTQSRPVRMLLGGHEIPQPIVWQFKLSPENAKPGDRVTLVVGAKLDQDWHTFAVTHNPKNFGKPTRIFLENITGLRPIDDLFKPNKSPETKLAAERLQQLHHGEVTWSRTFEVLPVNESDGYGVSGRVTYQVCKSTECRSMRPITFLLGKVVEQHASFVDPKLEAESTNVNQLSPDQSGGASGPEDDLLRSKQSLMTFVLVAVFSGFVSILTPCVFPMVPITVGFFLNQSKTTGRSSPALATIYLVTIVCTFTLLGVLLGPWFMRLGGFWWFNLAMVLILAILALALFGVFELQVPTFLVQFTSSREAQGGLVGVIFMALTFVVMSTPCTGPFVGQVLVWSTQGEWTWPIIGLAAYSLALASPFFVLALVPGLLGRLPKVGGWMNEVKVTMGFVVLGTIFYFIVKAESGLGTRFFSRNLVLSAWAVLALAAAIYLLSQLRLKKKQFVEEISISRLGWVVCFLAGALYFSSGLFGRSLSSSVEAILPEHGRPKLPWIYNQFDRAISIAEEQNWPVFLDFTGKY